ncbi:MAG TPA: glycosyltransferase family 4 protein, partial [Solirubrobacteraceae bacterium]|nr:glycosyltransferase family 4 protein [Solirubrobacteraceae bacterium]
MATRSLRIAWLGPAPGEDGGAAGVGTDLLHGLAGRGHRIDCFFPSAGQPIPDRLAGNDNITFNWGTSQWSWNRWYSRTRVGAFAGGMFARAVASVRLRRQIVERHRAEPYDLLYQFSSIESPAVPPSLARTVPLVSHPETHSAGELRRLIAERRLALRCPPLYRYAAVLAIMSVRSVVQRAQIRRANLLICISSVFRDHIVHDYGFPLGRTVVVPNPVRLARFASIDRDPSEPPTVLVVGRIAVRKGVEVVVAVARELLRRDVNVRIRIVGGPSLWSDYMKLLEDLPPENSEYVGSIASGEIPGELAASAVLLQASWYEPFGLTIAEALAAGVPVIGTSEVGAIEGVDRSVAAEVPPGDVGATATAIVEMLERVRTDPEGLATRARAEA